MSTNEIAFFIGLFGSLHCVGMCGPLAFAIPVSQNKWWIIVADKLLYNSGRIMSYTFLGLLTGFIGHQLWIAGLQQAISLLSGALIIMAAASRIFKLKLYQSAAMSKLVSPINNLLVYALKKHAGHFVVGVLNGFLPCGFVYLALIGAVNSPSPKDAAYYMLWFGAGTFPLMFIATLASGFISPMIRHRLNKTIPYLMLCLGCWFVLRGLDLNIPYLSPAKQQSGIICR